MCVCVCVCGVCVCAWCVCAIMHACVCVVLGGVWCGCVCGGETTKTMKEKHFPGKGLQKQSYSKPLQTYLPAVAFKLMKHLSLITDYLKPLAAQEWAEKKQTPTRIDSCPIHSGSSLKPDKGKVCHCSKLG